MAISRRTRPPDNSPAQEAPRAAAGSTPPASDRPFAQEAPAIDLSSGFGLGAQKPGGARYTRHVGVVFTPEQYAAIEDAALKLGYARHGAPSRLIREAVAKAVGFEP